MYFPELNDINRAAENIKEVVEHTPCQLSLNISAELGAEVYLKREDLQIVRSYKIRGAYNKMSSLSQEDKDGGVVCASAGNHAQGFAYSCLKLGVQGMVFMPLTTPNQKIEQVKMFGAEWIEIRLVGDTFDDAKEAALNFTKKENKVFIHPFEDEKVIEGQGTVGLEILAQMNRKIDYLFLPVGGGGLAAGVSAVFKKLSPLTRIIGVEPEGAPSMSTSINKGINTSVSDIDKFIDGAAVERVGDLNFNICKENLFDMITVPEGHVCSHLLQLYNRDAIVTEPAGALAIAGLDQFKKELKGKTVVSILSGGNSDITRMEEIKERALLHSGLKHYFIVKFPQRAGALKEFVADILGPNDDITHFEYTKKNSRAKGSAVVGIQLKDQKDFDDLLAGMKEKSFFGEYLNEKPDLFGMLV